MPPHWLDIPSAYLSVDDRDGVEPASLPLGADDPA